MLSICASNPMASQILSCLMFSCVCSPGTLLRKQGAQDDLVVAGSLLSDALRYEPHNHVGWYNLGLVRKGQGHSAEAEKHLFTAVTLAAAAPVLSYSTMPLLL